MNTPQRRRSRLLGLVWPFVLVVLIQALVAGGSLYTLSSVRAYVGGESLWSKAQKQATFFLTLYTDTGDSRYFDRFREAIAIPLAGRAARLELEKPKPDLEFVARSFRAGGNHADDVNGLIWLYTYFRQVTYLDTAIQRWQAADAAILELAALANAIRAEYALGTLSPHRIMLLKSRIELHDRKITPLTLAFSQALGEGSRVIQNVLLGANLLIAAVLIALAFWHTRKLLDQREAFEDALSTERERAEITLASIGEAVISTDTAGHVEYMNAAAERLIARTEDESRGAPLISLVELRDRRDGAVLDDLIGRVLRGELAGSEGQARTLVAADGSTATVSIGGAPLMVDGRTVGAILVLHDRSSEEDYLDRLSWQASHDVLTGCANRREFEDRLSVALKSRRPGGEDGALMFLDLDQFKLVNDTCGHAAGDQLLRQVSGVLAECLRSGDLLARIGGDEFGILIPTGTPDFVAAMAERLRHTVQKLHFAWKGRLFAVTASIGLVHLSEETLTIEEAMRAADVACYAAKEKGRNRVQVYRPSDVDLLSRVNEMAWVHRIYEALEGDRFVLYAQQITPIRGSNPSGAHIELLLRMLDAKGEIISPDRFIPAAERFGLMPLLDRWVVRRALATLAQRMREPAAVPVAVCAINLSGATFTDEAFFDFAREQFAQHGVSPSLVCFEITETSAITNLSSAIRFIRAMKGLGCHFALDDFGSGMSSFAYLKHLPVDYLKIDGSFVKDMLEDRIDRAMVEMIHHIGKVTGKQTIAEFVESQEIVVALTEIGVDFGQGFAIARPQPFTAMVDLFDLRQPLAADGSADEGRLRSVKSKVGVR